MLYFRIFLVSGIMNINKIWFCSLGLVLEFEIELYLVIICEFFELEWFSFEENYVDGLFGWELY